jgi:hypothetical protein
MARRNSPKHYDTSNHNMLRGSILKTRENTSKPITKEWEPNFYEKLMIFISEFGLDLLLLGNSAISINKLCSD